MIWRLHRSRTSKGKDAVAMRINDKVRCHATAAPKRKYFQGECRIFTGGPADHSESCQHVQQNIHIFKDFNGNRVKPYSFGLYQESLSVPNKRQAIT